MPIEKRPGVGLVARESEYEPLKPFATGGFYWDAGFQNLIRNYLGSFLPAVSRGKDQQGAYAAFRTATGPSEPLLRSSTIGNRKVPTAHLRSLRNSLDQFKAVANAPGTQPDYRALITKFQLPDPQKEPELYRFTGPFWNRRLHILWGCERTRNSSLPADEAVSALPEDKLYNVTQFLAGAALLLLLLCLLAACLWGWPTLKHWYAKNFNKPPIAALRLDSLDESNRVASISDNGSHDPDGTLQCWGVAWGDGKEDRFLQPPQKVSHTYDAERDYIISLWCVDNFGATSTPPASVEAKFDFLTRSNSQARLNQANKKLQEAEEKQRDADKKLQEASYKATNIVRNANEQATNIVSSAMADADRTRTSPPPVVATSATGPTPNPVSPPATAQQPVSTPPAPQPNVTAAAAQSASSETPPTPRNPLINDDRRGAQKQVEDLKGLEILKAGPGQFGSDGALDAMLVVRDRQFPNATLNVEFWEVNGKTYPTRNAQYTARLTVGQHIVRVSIARPGTVPLTAAARVTVNPSQTRITQPDFIVAPLR